MGQTSVKNPLPFTYVTGNHICQTLKICRGTLKNYEKKRGFPVERLPGRVRRYRLDRVTYWLENYNAGKEASMSTDLKPEEKIHRQATCDELRAALKQFEELTTANTDKLAIDICRRRIEGLVAILESYERKVQ